MPARKLTDVMVAGVDYPAKVKIEEVLDHEVLLISFDIAKDPQSGRTYWNLTVDDSGVKKVFSTGAVPLDKVLTGLLLKLEKGDAELPLLCTIEKEGNTYVFAKD
jgi:hypothetical protein